MALASTMATEQSTSTVALASFQSVRLSYVEAIEVVLHGREAKPLSADRSSFTVFRVTSVLLLERELLSCLKSPVRTECQCLTTIVYPVKGRQLVKTNAFTGSQLQQT